MKIAKDLKKEGITQELIDSINLSKRCSPVIFVQGEEPVNVLATGSGKYFVFVSEDTFLKDEKGNLITYLEKDVLIARARFLALYGEKEKQQEIVRVLVEKENKVKEWIDGFEKNINYYLKGSKGELDGLESIMFSLGKEAQPEKLQKAIELLPKQMELLELLKAVYKKGRINFLLNILGLEKRSNPVFTAHLNNEEEVKLLVKVFGAKSINEAFENHNEDIMGYLLTKLEVEEKY